MFHAVVRFGTISRAAAEIGLAQPSVSLGLAKLEADIGEPLLARGPGGSSPTAAGQILHTRVERMLAKIESAAARLFTPEDPQGAATVVRNLTGAQVRDHLAVDAAGSFRAAAAELGVAEPTLNRSVRQLNEMAGAALYRRTPLGFATTIAGARFASELRVALREIEQALDELATARGAANGRIAIGCLPLMPKVFLSEAVNAVIRRYPGVEISLLEDAYAPLADALRSGAVDVVLGSLRYRTDEFNEVALFPDPYVLVVRQGHPLLSTATISDADLAGLSWLIPWRGTPRRDLLETIFARLPSRPHVVIETSSLAMTRAVLAESNSVTLLAQSQITMEHGEHQLRTLQVQTAARPRIVGITTRPDWLPTSVQQSFIDRLVANAKAGSTGGLASTG
jgi:DNA-binding transcriptional LysR family regulator